MVLPTGPRIAPAAQEEVLSPPLTPGAEGAAVDEIYRALYILRKRKWVVALFAVATIVGVFAYTIRQPKVYRATSTLVIDHSAPKVLSSIKDVVERSGRGYWSQREYMNTQYKILKSRRLGQTVVDRMDLENDARFLPALETKVGTGEEGEKGEEGRTSSLT